LIAWVRDAETGQDGPLQSGDTLTDEDENEVGGSDGISVDQTTQSSGTSLARTIPADTLDTDEDRLVFISGVALAAFGTVVVTLGGTTIYNSAVSLGSASDWKVYGVIVRTGSSSQECAVTIYNESGSSLTTRTVGAEDLTGSLTLTVSASPDTVHSLAVHKVKAP
jgi:hypothetical protein